MTRVLVVDDEPQIRRALLLNLKARGYDVLEAATGEAAVQATASEHPDLVLLDLGLPGMSGLDVIIALRGWTQVPIIVLTVRDDERAKVSAFDAGADDYVTKPFGMDELLARLRAALRRSSPGVQVATVETAAWTLDRSAHTVVGKSDDELIRLTPTEWAIAEYLTRYPRRLVTQRQLVDAVWGPTYEPDANLLRVHLAHIRRKLEPDASRPRYFITEPGVGYRFEPDGAPSTDDGAGAT
ncbi:MAG: response regulator transcription factor [Acidimicrobiales bacterium]